MVQLKLFKFFAIWKVVRLNLTTDNLTTVSDNRQLDNRQLFKYVDEIGEDVVYVFVGETGVEG